jgi:hypothetical protein
MGAFPSCEDPIGRLAAVARVRRLQAEQAAALRQRVQRTLFEDIADTSTNRGVRHPGGFLAEVMAGYDPRARYGTIAMILDDIRSRGPGAMPTEGEWSELADLIAASPLICGEPVPLKVSARAAEKILPYIYAKQSEEKVTPNDVAPEAIKPLSPEEIEDFQSNWADEY